MQTYTYGVQIERDEDGVYIVTVPSLPGCHTYGRTPNQALVRVQEAIQSYLGALMKDDEPIPVEKQPSTSISVTVAVASFVSSWAGSRR